MPQVLATTKPVLFAATVSNSVVNTGLVEIGGAVASINLITAEDENTFLGAVAGKAASYRPLPPMGTQLETGEIYGYNNGLVIVRQSHVRTEHKPEDVPALFSVYRAGGGVLDWVANERVELGTQRKYNTVIYECIQAHTTQSDWTPPATPALWRLYVVPSPNWVAGVAYKVNDVVLYVPNGFSYKCLQAHTSQAGWNPPAVPALWAKV